MRDKPLFIPLNAEYYEAFRTGKKIAEYRKYGPRWNEKTCRVGRQVLLSCGYGKSRPRLLGVVFDFRVVPLKYCDGQDAYRECFPKHPGPVAEIYIRVEVD